MAVRNVTAGLAAALLLISGAGLRAAPQRSLPVAPPHPRSSRPTRKSRWSSFVPAAERVALADPSYKQHNPAFVKGGREAKLSDYEYFKSRFGGPARAVRVAARPRRPRCS